MEESKHQVQLLPEIQQAQYLLKNYTPKTASGKTVNYGDGVSINTDDVIFIENLINNHYSYTFRIKRESAQENAPIENLILSYMQDGTFKEILITYHLSSEEIQQIKNGMPVIPKVKSAIIELVKGTYNNGGILAKTVTGSSCGYEEEQIWDNCGRDQHGSWNVSDWGDCEAEKPPKMYTELKWVCRLLSTDTSDGSGQTGSGSSGGSGTGTGGDGNTNDSGIPTLPNLPLNRTPCEKTKKMLQKEDVKKGLDSLKKQSKLGGEKAFKVKSDGTTSPIIPGGEHSVEIGDMIGYVGFYHNHTPLGIKIHSPPDIKSLFTAVITLQSGSNSSDAFFGMYGYDQFADKYYHYIIRFNGTMQDAGTIAGTNYDLSELKKDFRERDKKLCEILPVSPYSDNGGATLNSKGLEKLFFETLNKMNISKNKITLQRIDDAGNVSNINLNSDGTTTAVPCP